MEVGFGSLGLDESIVETLTTLGYTTPTRIQAEAIPLLLSGRDVLGEAATGTGKTAAFAIPLLQRLAPFDHKQVRCLVLVPTRELAIQVSKAFQRYGGQSGVRVAAIYGGASIGPQFSELRRGVDVVIATPGRAIDHMDRGTLKLAGVEAVVLDEADEMLDMGFTEDLEKILGACPETRQTALFSATMPKHILGMAKRHQRDPAHVQIEKTKEEQGAPLVEQFAIITHFNLRMAAFQRVLIAEQPTSAIVFCRTREDVDEITAKLSSDGFPSEALHGGLSQAQRDAVMKRFREGRAVLLVATDVAARGLDVSGLSHVFNYDLPESPEVYTHRVGRTGRAGKSGVAMSFATPIQSSMLKRIERHTGTRIEWLDVPTSEQVRRAQLKKVKKDLEARIGTEPTEAELELVQQLGTAFGVERVAAAAIALWRESAGGGDFEALLAKTDDEAFSRPPRIPFDKKAGFPPRAGGFKPGGFKPGGFKGKPGGFKTKSADGFRPPHHAKKPHRKGPAASE